MLRDQQKNPTVRILTTELPQILRTTKCGENNLITQIECIISSGVKVVVLPNCHNSHFFTSAAILDGVNSLLAVLQSFGGPMAIVPPSAENLADILSAPADSNSLPNLGFRILVRQLSGSNDCALFLIAS